MNFSFGLLKGEGAVFPLVIGWSGVHIAKNIFSVVDPPFLGGKQAFFGVFSRLCLLAVSQEVFCSTLSGMYGRQ